MIEKLRIPYGNDTNITDKINELVHAVNNLGKAEEQEPEMKLWHVHVIADVAFENERHITEDWRVVEAVGKYDAQKKANKIIGEFYCNNAVIKRLWAIPVEIDGYRIRLEKIEE